MAWRLARSLVRLREQINAKWPNRNKLSDGTVGDLRHSKTASDHNPRTLDGQANVVSALDITHDPKNGVDCNMLTEATKDDPRVKYIIWNRRIYNASIKKAWRPYHGVNPHNKHAHWSVRPEKKHYDSTADWNLSVPVTSQPVPTPPVLTSTEKLGVKPPVSTSMTVKEVQSALLSLGYAVGKVDGKLGPKTIAAIKSFQGSNKLKKDGIPGPMTSTALRRAVQALNPSPVVGTPQPVPVAPGPIVGPEQNKNDLSDPREAVKFYQSLGEIGWSKVQAVALVANLLWESGGNTLKPPPGRIKFNAVGDKDKNGHYQSFGAGQWNRKAGRFGLLETFAKGKGTDWQDGETQLAFLNHELHSTERKAGTLLRAAATLEEAMAAAIKVWRPSIPHIDRRLAIARKLMDGNG